MKGEIGHSTRLVEPLNLRGGPRASSIELKDGFLFGSFGANSIGFEDTYLSSECTACAVEAGREEKFVA